VMIARRNATLIRSAALLALFLLVPIKAQVTTSAQQTGPHTGQSTKGAVIKGRAPVSKEILKASLPKANEATLKNGLRVLLLEYHKVPTFSMEMVILSGGLSDPTGRRGLAQLTAALLREGTLKRTSREIAEQLDSLGATLFASSGLSSFTTNVSASGLTESLDQVLDIFADVIRNPKFPADELEKYKARTISQYQLLRSSPQFLAQEQFSKAVYGDHPAAMIFAPIDSLKKMTTEDLARFHAEHYLPNNSLLAVVGDLTMKELLPKVERAFGDWKQGQVPKTLIPPAPKPAPSKIYLVDRPGSVQTLLQLGDLSIERTDPDYYALTVMNRILGGGPSSRLFLNVREDKGYAYSVGSSFSSSKYRGTWFAFAPVRTEVTDGAMQELMKELTRMREEKVSAADLENAKRSIVGSFALSLEQPQALLQNIITQKLYDLPADYWDKYPQKIAAVTADEVQQAARKYIDLDHLQVVAVGDASKIRDVMAKYGKVEVYTTEGKPVRAEGAAQE
jgi:zinc protease